MPTFYIKKSSIPNAMAYTCCTYMQPYVHIFSYFLMIIHGNIFPTKGEKKNSNFQLIIQINFYALLVMFICVIISWMCVFCVHYTQFSCTKIKATQQSTNKPNIFTLSKFFFFDSPSA